MKKSWLSQRWFYIGTILYCILGYTTLGIGEKWAEFFYQEDHYFENVGAISLFIASVISFNVFLRAMKSRSQTGIHWVKLLVYLSLAFLYFFGAGEEISWGQRIFGIEEPASLAEQNTQGELNIHNLAIFENSKFIKADSVFNVFWFSFAVLIPFTSLLWKGFEKFAGKFMPIVHWGIGLLFLFNYLSAQVAERLYASVYNFSAIPFIQAVQEIKESNYEFLYIFVALYVLWDFVSAVNEKPIVK
ncbi:MAG: hypothetical protein OHK003_24770 [Anaerolineales bacterium]